MTSERWGRRGSAPYRPIPELEEMRRRFEDDIVRPLMRNSPIRPGPGLDEMRRKFEEDIVRPVMRSIYGRIPEEQKGWAPAIDLIESGNSLILKVELPGMKLEDIDVSISDDSLTVKGERKPEAGIKDEDFHRSEIAYGNFYRTISIPVAVDTTDVSAVYEDGILRVILKKVAGTEPKKVSIPVTKANV